VLEMKKKTTTVAKACQTDYPEAGGIIFCFLENSASANTNMVVLVFPPGLTTSTQEIKEGKWSEKLSFPTLLHFFRKVLF